MSIRAYKLIEVKTEEEPTFNMGRDYQYIERYIISEPACSLIDIDTELIKAELDEITDSVQRAILGKVLNDDPDKEGRVTYFCY